jgi:hypothetical protein
MHNSACGPRSGAGSKLAVAVRPLPLSAAKGCTRTCAAGELPAAQRTGLLRCHALRLGQLQRCARHSGKVPNQRQSGDPRAGVGTVLRS